MKTEIEMAKEGEFLREYGKQYFVVFTEALNIGRVKVEMVPIGKSGKDGVTFYLTTEKMLELCNEILDGKFTKKLEADAANAYPSAYKYMTGEDGHLQLNIGGGKVGCRIQMRDANSKKNYQMAVSMESMITMARKYMLDTGMVNVCPNSYYATVVAAFEEGREERKGFRKPSPEELEKMGDVVNTNNAIDDSVDQPVVESPKPTAPVEEKNEEPNEANTDAATNEERFVLNISGAKSLKKGFYVFNGSDEHNNPISLMFRKADADAISWFKDFENTAMSGAAKITIMGEKRDNFILYKRPAKK